jgi:hypothetical protein
LWIAGIYNSKAFEAKEAYTYVSSCGSEPVSSHNQKHTNKKTRQGFLKKHGKTLSLVGALIVFVTYVVKEGFREHVKDLVDAAENGRNVFVIRNDNNTLAFQLLAIEDSLNAALNDIPKRGQEILSLDGIERPMTILSHMQQDIGASLDNMAALTEKNHGNTSDRTEIETLAKRYDGLRDYHKWLTEAIVEVRRGKYAVFEHVKHEELVKIEVLDLVVRTERLTDDTRDRGSSVLKAVGEKKDKEQRYYGILTWVSYGLYTVGWSLGLLGKMFGVELPVGE